MHSEPSYKLKELFPPETDPETIIQIGTDEGLGFEAENISSSGSPDGPW